MSNTWRAFMSPLHEDKLGVTNNNKQDISSFVISSRQTPSKKKEPSFSVGQQNECLPSSKDKQYKQDILDQEENTEFREQIDDIQNKVVTLKKKMMSVSHEKQPGIIIPYHHQAQSNLIGCQQVVQQYPSTLYQQQITQQPIFQQKPEQVQHLHAAVTDRSNNGYTFQDSKRQKEKKISILPNDYTQNSTTRSQSNKVGSSLAQRNSFFEDLDNAQLIINSENVNPFYISEVANQENTQNIIYTSQKRGIEDSLPQKEEQNETEMLKRCMMKIQMKLEKEKQKRRELKMIIKQSSKSIGALKKDISNYQLDMQIVKQLTLNTTRAIEARTSSSTLRPSSTTATQFTTVKKANCAYSSQKSLSKSKERLSNIINISVNQQHPKNKTMEALKVFGRRKSKSMSNTLNDFCQKGFLNINMTQLDSSDSSIDDISATELKNNQIGSPNFQNQQILQPKYQKIEGEIRSHTQQLQQINKIGKARQSSEVNNFSNELKQIQQSKKEKAQYYLSKMDKGKKKSLNLGDTSSSISSSNMSGLKFLQQNYQLQNQLKQKKTQKNSNKTINASNCNKSQIKQTAISILTDNIPTDSNLLNCVSSSGSSIISSAAATSQNVKKNINQNIISKKLNEFKKFKEALNTEISELKKEFESNDPLLASLNFEKLKEKALKDKQVSLGLNEKTPLQYQNNNQRNMQTFNGQMKNLDGNKYIQNCQQQGSDQFYDTDQLNSGGIEDQDFQTPITHDRDVQSDANSLKTNQKLKVNQSYSNNNQRTTSKTTFNESSELGSVEKQRSIQSKIMCKDLLTPSDDTPIQQKNISQNPQQVGTGQFLNNMLITESYTGEEYLNSDRKNNKKLLQQDMQKQDYKLFQNQLNYFKMQETLNKHLRQYETQMIENQTQEKAQQPQQQKKINQNQKINQNIQQNQTSSNDPYIKNFSEPSSEQSIKQQNSQSNQNTLNQQTKQQQIHNLIYQQQQQYLQQQANQGLNTINNHQFTPTDIQTICQNVQIPTTNSNQPSYENSEKTLSQNKKQQMINSSEKKRLEQYKKQLFPYSIDFNDNDFIYNKNQNQFVQKQKPSKNAVNLNDFSTNDSLQHLLPTQQYDQQLQNTQQKSLSQQMTQQKINKPCYAENENKQIKRQQSETLLNNQSQQNQQQHLLINQQQLHNHHKINSSTSNINQNVNLGQTQPSQLFYKTPQNQINQTQIQNINNTSNSNSINQNSCNSNSQGQNSQGQSSSLNNLKNISSQQQFQQEQFAQFLLQSHSHLIQSGGFTDRQHNKSFSSQEKMYPSQDTLTSPLINLKSPDLNKSQLKKSGKNSFPALPKSPNSVVNYYQDPINFSNITGVHSSNQSESLIYTASIGTTPAKSVFYSTPMQNQSININSSINNFFYTNNQSLQNNSSIQNNTQNNNNISVSCNNNSIQNPSELNNNNMNKQNESSQNQAFLQNIVTKDQTLEYTTPQKK